LNFILFPTFHKIHLLPADAAAAAAAGLSAVSEP
jgi:hypothetical protein